MTTINTQDQPQINNILQCLNYVKNSDCDTYKTMGKVLQIFFDKRGQTMPPELAAFTSNSTYLDELHYNAVHALRNLAKGSYNDYQVITIKEPGMILLHGHTKAKYDIAKKYIIGDVKTILDAGSSLGGIGLKLASGQSISRVILDNITISELNTSREICDKLGLENVEFTSEPLLNLDVKVDMGMYFAIFHHLLRNNTIDELLQFVVRQVSQVAIIELPIRSDALLDNIVAGCNDPWNTRYAALSSIESLRTAIGAYFTIKEEIAMDYGNGNLHSHAFVCFIKSV